MSDVERLIAQQRNAFIGLGGSVDVQALLDALALQQARIRELEAHDAEVAAKAFDEGVAAWGEVMVPRLTAVNPYRKKPEDKRVLLTHPHDGHGPDDTCFDCENPEATS
jgi:hypothetical protein